MPKRPLSPIVLAITLALCVPAYAQSVDAPAAAQDPVVDKAQPQIPEPLDTPPPTVGKPQAADARKPETTESKVPLDEIRRYVAVYNAIKAAYVEPVDDHELMQSAIRGLLLDLDPHSAYLEGDAADNFDEQSRGNYEGIGVEIQRVPDGSLRVIAPIDDTPAARAGIKSGDLIVAVDGVPLTPADEDATSLRGKAGTTLELTVLREGANEPLTIKVERQTIKIASVRTRMLEPGYGYVRVSAFQADTAAEFERQLESLNQQSGGKLKGLVLDLRSNPGGLLTAAVQIADALLEEGTIVSTRGRIAISDAVFGATPGDRLGGAPIVVLVDSGSASASEVLAGALADNRRALVMGSRTFGKGSVQTLLPLDNGDSVKLTTARYYTPSGKSIQALGIVPDVLLHAENDDGKSASKRYTEASLPGHLGGDGEGAAGAREGEVLEGDRYIDLALAKLKTIARQPRQSTAGAPAGRRVQ
ncbi:MAG: S41 family peptidase [Lysobacter sp.]